MGSDAKAMDEARRARLSQAFSERVGGFPSYLVRAPGRVNLIGEHTDYNDGYVLPIAIEPAVWIALRPRADREVRVWSLDYESAIAIDLDDLQPAKGGWREYLAGTAWALQTADFELRGWEGVVVGEVPIGAGLSSSAALEMATARAFAAAGDLPWDAGQMARLCQRAENDWVGVQCGIMDQMISGVGQAGHAVLIDCRDLRTQAVPLPADTQVVILDTDTRRGLAGSEYNQRRSHCEEAAAFFGVDALRDVTPEALEVRMAELDPVIGKRARHVVTENVRTREAADALARGDATRVGHLMNESHASLRDDFEVSSRELDIMVELAQGQPGCLGARMTGAGFGGCAVALVARASVGDFVERVAAAYRDTTDLDPRLYVTGASEGASLASLPPGE